MSGNKMWMLAAFIALVSVFLYQYSLQQTNARNKENTPERNIIVVGGGLAGMSAAIEVKKKKKKKNNFLLTLDWYFVDFRPNYTVLKWQ